MINVCAHWFCWQFRSFIRSRSFFRLVFGSIHLRFANINSIFQFSYIRCNCSICKNKIVLWPFHLLHVQKIYIFIFIYQLIAFFVIHAVVLLWLYYFALFVEFSHLCVYMIFEADAETATLLYLYQAQLKFIKILL